MNNVTYHIEGKMHPDFPVISFSTNVYDNPADIFGSIKDLSQHFKAVEFEIGEAAENVFWAMSEVQRLALAKQIRDFCQQNGVVFTVHAGWWGRQYNLCSPDLQERVTAVKCLAAAVNFSYEAGATSVTFHPGYKDKYNNTTLLNCLIESINAVMAQCNTAGLVLCLENMGGERPKYPVFTVDEHIHFHQKTGCFITIDVTHLCSVHAYGEALFDAITRLAPVTRHLHIADLEDTHHQHLPITEGNLPLSDVLNKFAQAGYRGVAVVEEFIPRYSTEFYLKKATDYQQKIEMMRNAAA